MQFLLLKKNEREAFTTETCRLLLRLKENLTGQNSMNDCLDYRWEQFLATVWDNQMLARIWYVSETREETSARIGRHPNVGNNTEWVHSDPVCHNAKRLTGERELSAD